MSLTDAEIDGILPGLPMAVAAPLPGSVADYATLTPTAAAAGEAAPPQWQQPQQGSPPPPPPVYRDVNQQRGEYRRVHWGARSSAEAVGGPRPAPAPVPGHVDMATFWTARVSPPTRGAAHAHARFHTASQIDSRKARARGGGTLVGVSLCD